jgi:hypothetical protein
VAEAEHADRRSDAVLRHAGGTRAKRGSGATVAGKVA